MSNIRKEYGRHDWMRVRLHGPGGNVGRNLVPGILCRNCRKAIYGEDPDRPTVGCMAEVKVANVGHARHMDYLEQESRIRNDQDAREIQDEIRLGARDTDGKPLVEAQREHREEVRDYLDRTLQQMQELQKG